MLPIILQHVRELAEVHLAAAERGRYKIITPFPPSGPDFHDFAEEELEFGDPPADGAEASEDTVRADEFFKRTDGLFYDYSYGIKSEDQRLSADICRNFFLEAQTDTSGIAFSSSFAERRDAFLNRYKRQRVDLAGYEFRYTSPSPVSWNAERVVLNSSEVERLKTKAIAVYQDLALDNVGFIKALIDEISSSNYSSIEYDFGSFDVIREWMDPRLFESPEWKFSSGSRTLYGESDPFFTENDVNFCYAQRFYVIRKYAATPGSTPQPKPPIVRDHRARDFAKRRGAVFLRAGGIRIDDHRRNLRNALIHQKVARIESVLTSVAVPAPPPEAARPPRAGYVWIPATPTVPGHWERERAGSPPPSPPAAETPAGKPSYKIAAVKCRILPRIP